MDKRVFDYLERKMHYHDDERDYRRGVKGTGRYGMGGSRYRGRRDYEDDERRDYEDYEDYGERHESLRLTRTDMRRWKEKMQNFDGTHGEKFDVEQVKHIAHKLGIHFNEFTEKEFCLAVNMMYSDYGHVIKTYVQADKELQVCAEMARAFLDDPDGPEPSEKLALYFHCIVEADV